MDIKKLWKSEEEIEAEEEARKAEQEEQISNEDLIVLLKETVQELLEKNMTEEEMLKHINVYPSWLLEEEGADFAEGEKVRYEGKLYKITQTHKKQNNWEPGKAPSLFTEITPEGIIPEWKQPSHAENAYNTGDKVTYKDQIWESKIDANTSVPDGDEPHNRYWEPK